MTTKQQTDLLKEHYATGITRSTEYRLSALKRMRQSIEDNFDAITDALAADLHKSPSESYMSEISIVMNELDDHIRHLRRWSRPKRTRSALAVFPSRGVIVAEPMGTVMIMAPWNYPFNLSLCPLVGAVSAGNTVALKPSQTASATAKIITQIIAESFDAAHVALFNGDHEQANELLDEAFDHIFFTGSAAVGRQVMLKAAEHLTPVTLELGGKSPCIVDQSANIALAARRTAWGKSFNAGQTCIAPDYVFVHSSVKEEFVEQLKKALAQFFGSDPQQSPFYPRIITTRAFDRLKTLMEASTIIYGGQTDREDKYIAPTIIDNVTPDSPIMQQEIFGPLIPIMTFDNLGEVTTHVNSHPKPLAFYYFGRRKTGMELIGQTTSGGACINDVVMYIANPHLPFGGVGNSGTGRYHSYASFATFSNLRSVLLSSTAVDIPLRYAPFRSVKLLRRFV